MMRSASVLPAGLWARWGRDPTGVCSPLCPHPPSKPGAEQVPRKCVLSGVMTVAGVCRCPGRALGACCSLSGRGGPSRTQPLGTQLFLLCRREGHTFWAGATRGSPPAPPPPAGRGARALAQPVWGFTVYTAPRGPTMVRLGAGPGPGHVPVRHRRDGRGPAHRLPVTILTMVTNWVASNNTN